VALDVEHVRQALAKWADFQVGREPRPIVLTMMDPGVLDRLAADTAWRSVFNGLVVPEAELPLELRSAAIDYCRNVQTGAPRPLGRIVRAPGPFATDRGVQELPACMMYPDDRRWPFIVLDPEFSRQMTWRPENLSEWATTEESELAPDGRTLTYRFMGTPTAYAAYPHAEVFETETAVLVDPMETSLDAPNSIRLEYVEVREVVVCLNAPLGNRVLVWLAHGVGTDTCGSPRTVVSSA
jgi:hypothetical protein